MILILRRQDPANGNPAIGQNNNFNEQFLPEVGDKLFFNGQNLTVVARAFNFGAAPNIEGVELLLSIG